MGGQSTQPILGALPVYNMPSGVPFLRSLAAGLVQRWGDKLPQVLVFLPTRRAVRALGDAFVEHASQSGSGVALLPRMRPLADIDPEEPPFEPGELVGVVAPAINTAQRRFDMAQIIARYHARISELPVTPSSSLAIADQLLAIMDDAAMEEIDLSQMAELDAIKAQAAEHYQNAATLYEIIQTYWPKYLADQNQMEPMARRVALLNALTDLWTQTPPDYPVVIAGSTGTLAATARLMHCVARLPESAIVLPGIDSNLRVAVWDNVTEQHPQNALKKLIKTIGVELGDIADWTPIVPCENMSARRRVLSEALVPADSADDWPARIENLKQESPGDVFARAFEGLSIIEAASHDEEALTIALILRETLEDKDARAALITPDPALARRVKAKLRRWQVEIDYSQGEPLEETPLGAYLTGIMRLGLCADKLSDKLSGDDGPNNPVDLAFIAKHRLSNFGLERGELRRHWVRLERKILRGPRENLTDLMARIDDYDERDRPLFDPDEKTALRVIYDFSQSFAPLSTSGKMTAKAWAEALTACAQKLTEEKTGDATLWRGDAGEKAVQLLNSLMIYGAPLGEMNAQDFADLLATLMRGKVVRPRYGTHPRLQILGPLEARMIEAELIILGGLNEGVWPAPPAVEPFLSRGMRRELGLSLPERRFGLQAHDFAELASNPKVILTRSGRSDDGPTVASRWLWRLQTLAAGAFGEGAFGEGAAADALRAPKPYLNWARELDYVAPDEVKPAEAPLPNPPLAARWPSARKLAVTRLTNLVRDPYAHYARTILKLPVLDALDAPFGPLQLGICVHDALENFAKNYKDNLPKDAQSQLTELFVVQLATLGISPQRVAAERPRLENMARKYLDWFTQTRADGWAQAGVEITGKLTIDAPEGPFTLTAKSDRIDRRGTSQAGSQTGNETGIEFKVVDYKTGAAPSNKLVQAGFDIQLPLQAAMLAKGGFAEQKKGETQDMVYLSLRGYSSKNEVSSIVKKDWPVERFVEQALKTIEGLIAYFDAPDAVYHAQPRIQFTSDYGDYDQLSRRGEWAKIGDPTESQS